ncbi:MAG: sphingomyelin phosphodiesterase [Bacteroidota bacterium]
MIGNRHLYAIGLFLLSVSLISGLGCHATKPDKSAVDTYESSSNEIRILTYNLYLRAPELFFWNQQQDRIAALRPALLGYDVLVLQEVFGKGYREQLIDLVADVYPHYSDILGGEGTKQDAGVLIFSRWPISQQAALPYGDICAGSDCLATKGAIYLNIAKEGHAYHIFGTHLQASEEHQLTREGQLALLKDFIDQQKIDQSEAVLIVGDLNVDLYLDEQNQAYSNMLDSLSAIHPPNHGTTEYPPTFDIENNAFAKGKKNAFLDYLLYSSQHLRPKTTYNEVKPFKVEKLDLSDHYAVMGYFGF